MAAVGKGNMVEQATAGVGNHFLHCLLGAIENTLKLRSGSREPQVVNHFCSDDFALTHFLASQGFFKKLSKRRIP